MLGDISVNIVHKNIKNIHLSVNPPEGAVKVSAPTRYSVDDIRVFVISKLAWIKKQQAKFRGQERETPREFLDRESHYVWGKRYLLEVTEKCQRPEIELTHSHLIMRINAASDSGQRQTLLDAWYRQQVRLEARPLIAKWERQMAVKVGRMFVQKMKTKWGSCNSDMRHIRLNSELAKKPKACLEYIVVHELVHLITRTHGDQFHQLMDKYLPHWSQVRQMLNTAPLAHTDWYY